MAAFAAMTRMGLNIPAMSLDLQKTAARPKTTIVSTVARPTAVASHDDILHLAELVPVVRQRFELAETFADDAIFASLRMIASQSEMRERWRVAYSSNLAIALSRQGRDLNTALNTLLALLPRPTS